MVRSNAPHTDDAADREVEVHRTFDASTETLWDAWTNPARIVLWWGPRGFTTTIDEMDVRPGGVWTHTMHGPDGTDYPSRAVFREVIPRERISYMLTGGSENERVECEVTWTFVPEGRATRLTMRMRFPSVEARDRAIETLGVRDAGVETLNRLAELVGTDMEAS
ncbi:MAG TPA: SRPBCC domain-containing protein [Gemmatimonadales bacterium]|nr:SRPBCC domain-containing protein [Gemmatimonadales bacterium]